MMMVVVLTSEAKGTKRDRAGTVSQLVCVPHHIRFCLLIFFFSYCYLAKVALHSDEVTLRASLNDVVASFYLPITSSLSFVFLF